MESIKNRIVTNTLFFINRYSLPYLVYSLVKLQFHIINYLIRGTFILLAFIQEMFTVKVLCR